MILFKLSCNVLSFSVVLFLIRLQNGRYSLNMRGKSTENIIRKKKSRGY